MDDGKTSIRNVLCILKDKSICGNGAESYLRMLAAGPRAENLFYREKHEKCSETREQGAPSGSVSNKTNTGQSVTLASCVTLGKPDDLSGF